MSGVSDVGGGHVRSALRNLDATRDEIWDDVAEARGLVFPTTPLGESFSGLSSTAVHASTSRAYGLRKPPLQPSRDSLSTLAIPTSPLDSDTGATGVPPRRSTGSFFTQALPRVSLEASAELGETLRFDLTDPLSGKIERVADFLERVFFLLSEAESQPQDLPFARTERFE
jgi:hypothetical protein